LECNLSLTPAGKQQSAAATAAAADPTAADADAAAVRLIMIDDWEIGADTKGFGVCHSNWIVQVHADRAGGAGRF
jgi:hypothetical protein